MLKKPGMGVDWRGAAVGEPLPVGRQRDALHAIRPNGGDIEPNLRRDLRGRGHPRPGSECGSGQRSATERREQRTSSGLRGDVVWGIRHLHARQREAQRAGTRMTIVRARRQRPLDDAHEGHGQIAATFVDRHARGRPVRLA